MAEAESNQLQIRTRALDSSDSHTYLAHYLAEYIRKAFVSFPQAERLDRQLELANQVLSVLSESSPEAFDKDQARILRAELLLMLSNTQLHRADTPLSTSCLMTGTRQDPTLISQLRKEIVSADRVSILCSFIKWSGVRILEDSLKTLTTTKSLRVITTSYMGATDPKAIEFLHSLPNTEVQVSYDTRRTRLHAKAYIIHRDTGFGVAYIGSSNLSQAALTDGLEWNVKISQEESPHLWQKVCATFDTYWHDNEFVAYTADSKARLTEAIRSQQGSANDEGILAFFTLAPYPFQQEILDKLEAERSLHNRFRNLVVAATGTGKTVISAFDYLRFRRQQENKLPRLLFIAHREEILKQSLGTFRNVLRDFNFGDLLISGSIPEQFDALFCSIQSFNAQEFWKQVSPDFYDFVVVDEFHHTAAPSYQRLLSFVRPQILLGLTATPERMDALDVVAFFDGHIAAEIRLPDAINRKLLCPFQYFGVTDAVDFSAIRWQRGGYDQQGLDNLLTGNNLRANLVVDKTREILLEVSNARGLGFCVSVRHAEFMADVFSKAGIPSVSLSSESPKELRQTVQHKLVAREINFIFVVDLYNEGVDIPEIDTILLLRPTESLTIFLQQLGRGLRLHVEKDCLTVLDFIGQAHQNFNYEQRFRSLLGQTSRRVEEEIQNGFPHLPAGCSIALERLATKYIVDNIRQATTYNRRRLVQRIRSFTAETGRELTLPIFTAYHRLELDDIYRRDSWSRLQVEAGFKADFNDPDERQFAKGLRRVAHADTARLLRFLLDYLSEDRRVFEDPKDEEERRFLIMLHLSLWGVSIPTSREEGDAWLRRNPTLRLELRELFAIKLEQLDEIPIQTTLPFLCPLQIHADYTTKEVLAALGISTLEFQNNFREGVLYAKSLKADLLFVTLNKTESDYSPTTMYQDYAISADRFHWQSQSTTPAEGQVGQRYIHHAERGHSILLFVREDKTRNSLSMPYSFLGPVEYERHEGSRPMSITWRLRHRLPAKLMRHVRRLANE
jgi:superfamily II DNA or RNA helicase